MLLNDDKNSFFLQDALKTKGKVNIKTNVQSVKNRGSIAFDL
jgi:hypothetical protein